MRKRSDLEKKKNPLHREYGLLSNVRYILRNMTRYNKAFLPLMFLGLVCAPMIQYLWSFISKHVIDMITGEKGMEGLLWLMVMFTVIQIVSTMLNTFYYSEIGWRYIDTRLRMIREKNEKIMTMDFQNLEDSDVMDCVQKATNAHYSMLEGIEGMMRGIVEFLTGFAVVVVGMVILGTMNVFVVLIMLLLCLVTAYFNNRTNKNCKEQIWDPLMPWWRKNNYMMNLTTDFGAAKDIRMFGLAGWLSERLREMQKERYEAQVENARRWLIFSWISNVLFAAVQAIIYAWLIYAVVQGEMTIGNFSLYLGTSLTFYNYVHHITASLIRLMQRSREVDDFRSCLDINSSDSHEEKEVPACETYEFEFRNVSFRYPKAKKYALRNLSLTLKAGERLAVVGLNGAGKSTFIKLLLRLYEPTEGEILLNGVNVKEYSRKSYYKVFAPVFQEVELFAFPLAENVSMNTPEATNREWARSCLVSAGLKEKLLELPKDIDTEMLKVIYDDGTDFSGGEKQKLALARALYKDSPVVVLDEPTAALDALAESRLYSEFDKLIGGKTAVYISHRLSSTQFCSNVAMFVDGKLKEYGTHEQLMGKNGAYAEMFRIQAQYYTENQGKEAVCHG